MRYTNQLLTGVILLGLLTPAVSRADGLDDEARRAAKKLLTHFHTAEYKNVGILKFEVRKGGDKGDISMNSGRMNELMATRLENALTEAVAINKDHSPIGISRGASAQAARIDAKATFHTAEGRQALFANTYEMVWGDPSKVDAFVTGCITVAADGSTLKIDYRIFGSDISSIDRSADLPMTRQYLADLGAAYVVSGKRLVVRAIGDSDLDLPLEVDARPNNPEKVDPVPPVVIELPPAERNKKAWAEAASLVELKIFYNDELQQPLGDELPTPAKGTKIRFTIKAREKVAIKLTVNGQNTADSSPDLGESQRGAKWILQKDKEYTILGFYKGDKYETFAVADPEEGRKAIPSELANSLKLGQIEMIVFRAPEATTPALVTTPNFREYVGHSATVDEARRAINKTAVVRTAALIVPGEVVAEKLESEKFDIDERAAFNLKLTYFKAAKAPPIQEK